MLGESGELTGQGRFRALLKRVAAGDAAATETLISEYGRHILRAVRRRMNQGVRDQFDSQDFEQAVWASFFGHLSVVERFDSENHLAAFLIRMASNKVIDAGRRAQVRPAQNASHGDVRDVVTDHRRRVSQPTPSQFAVAREQWGHIVKGEDDRHLRVLKLKRAGATQVEIAAAMGVSERHVRRMLSRISQKRLSDTESAS
ncbi:MAG: sigma-70 family RNA polymerase sigma factor [Fuerstiella sp.]|jgi:RNA polymerase sigma factor (sigma-70 family)|nr:sigma-70 family RNA polymerase sigma factor [Fuerstiella sp.]MCP4506018.1 sigma-70 family RNA polymerase sigma factor [Fuerstiella sp.]